MSGRSFDLLRAVRELPLPPPPPKLEPSDKLILAILAMRADPSGFCWTSYTTLAANGWMGVRTAKTAIARLVSAGLVEVRIRRIDDGAEGRRARAANGYRVLLKVASDTEVVQPQHEVVPLPHDLVQQAHQGSAVIAPGVVPLPHGGGAVTAHRSDQRSAPSSAPEKSFALTGAPNGSKNGKKSPKHTPDEIAAKERIVDAFFALYEAAKGCKPKNVGADAHAAAFKLAKLYGADGGSAVLERAFEDPFVVDKNCSLTFIASKADTFRGKPLARPNRMVQQAPAVSSWRAGDGQ
jgi:helix-turn-helix protein